MNPKKKVANKTKPKHKTKSKARLGKGLEALLGDVRPGGGAAAQSGGGVGGRDTVRELPIEQLQRGKYQPRLDMDKHALAELATTIRAQGVIQPLVVREVGANRFEIIAGERRWRGAQLAKLRNVPVVVRELTDRDAMAVALIENIQRQDLNALEEAAGLQRLLDEFGLTHEQIAEAVGRSRATVTNLLRLLGLQPGVKKLLLAREIEMGHGRALVSLPKPQQLATAQKIIAEKMPVNRAEKMVQQLLRGDATPSSLPPKQSADVARLQQELSKRLGARVTIAHTDGKGGKLVVYYHSLDELDGILGRIK